MARRSLLFRGKYRCRSGACLDDRCISSRRAPEEDAIRSGASRQSLHLWTPPWAVLDCQTTGIDAGLRVIEIAIVGHNGRTIIETLVNPGVPIPSSATTLTGIDDAAVRCAPNWKTIWPELEAVVLAQNRIIAWNAEFDLLALRRDSGRCHDLSWTTAIDSRFVDLAPIASRFADLECSFEDACSLAGRSAPQVGKQRALAYCRAAMAIINAICICEARKPAESG